MKTTVFTPDNLEKIIFELADCVKCVGELRPLRFQKCMRENRGSIRLKDILGETTDGLELKNPVIVGLGDSVTAGHFEFVGNPEKTYERMRRGLASEKEPVEITDARVCYLERFRLHLIEKYEQTSVSVINSGIAGDTIIGMQKRLFRDVIRYQPDLVLINGSLNWLDIYGDTGDFERVLREVVSCVKEQTHAEIILMTPNLTLPYGAMQTKSLLADRIEAIRRVSVEKEVCLADTSRVWEEYCLRGYPLEKMLANGINHPTISGHELYARVLMKLMEE